MVLNLFHQAAQHKELLRPRPRGSTALLQADWELLQHHSSKALSGSCEGPSDKRKAAMGALAVKWSMRRRWRSPLLPRGTCCGSSTSRSPAACHREAPFDLSEAVNRRGVDVQGAFLAGEEGNKLASWLLLRNDKKFRKSDSACRAWKQHRRHNI